MMMLLCLPDSNDDDDDDDDGAGTEVDAGVWITTKRRYILINYKAGEDRCLALA